MSNRLTAAFALAAVLILGASVRAIGLGSKSLWYNEALSARSLDFTLDEVIARSTTPEAGHPPLYFAILHLWASVFGRSDFALREPALVFGLLTILGIYFLTRELARHLPEGTPLDKNTPLLAALLVALSPLQIHLSQQVRGYTLGTCLFVGSSWTLLIALRGGKRGGLAWGSTCLLSLAFCFTHYLSIVCVASQMFFATAYVLTTRNHRARQGTAIALWTAVLGILYLFPRLSLLVAQSEIVRHDYLSPISWRGAAGELFQTLTATFDAPPFPDPVVSWLFTLLLAIMMVILLPAAGWAGRFVALTSMFPVLFAAAYSISSNRSILQARYLSFAQTSWLIGVALLVGLITSRSRRLISSACLVLASVYFCHESWTVIGPSSQPGMRGAVAYVATHVTPGDLVVSRTPYTFFGVAHYERGRFHPLLMAADSRREIQRGAEHLHDGEVLSPEAVEKRLSKPGVSGVWFISTEAYVNELVARNQFEDRLEFVRQVEFEQDYHFEGPVLVEYHRVKHGLISTRYSTPPLKRK